jgi:hypothetical protein
LKARESFTGRQVYRWASARSINLCSEAPERFSTIVALERASEGVTAPLLRPEHALHGLSAFVVTPLFAFSNAGVGLSGSFGGAVTPAVILGLAVGKSLAITGAAFAAVSFASGLATQRRQLDGLARLRVARGNWLYDVAVHRHARVWRNDPARFGEGCQFDLACDAPFSAAFTVYQNARRVAEFRSDADGRFTVMVAAGVYRVVPDADAPVIQPPAQAKTVEVLPVGLTEVRLEFDTGIR